MVSYEENAPGNGGNVTEYKTEWDISPNFDSVHAQYIVESPTYAIQKVTVAAPTAGLSGTFTLSYGDYLGDFSVQVGGSAQFVTLNHGSNTLVVVAGTADMTLLLARGDFIQLRNAVNNETWTFQVCTDTTGSCAFNSTHVPLAAVGNDTDTPYTYMGYTSYVKVPVYMSDTTLGPVSVTAGASGHLLHTVWADGSTPNDLRSKINRGDLIRLGDPFTGPLFRCVTHRRFHRKLLLHSPQ